MWLLVALILIMPYEANPYLYLGENLLGIFPDFTVIKLLGLLGFAWAGMRLAAGDRAAALLSSRPARLFLVFFAVVVVIAMAHGTGFQYAVSRYLGFLVFLPFVIVAVRTETDLRRVLKAMVLAYVLVFPYALRQMLRFGERLGTGLYETNYLATILVLLVPLAFVFASQEREPRGRALWTGAGVLLVLMVFLTSSRGGFVGLLAAGMVYVYRRYGLGPRGRADARPAWPASSCCRPTSAPGPWPRSSRTAATCRPGWRRPTARTWPSSGPRSG